MKRIALSVFTIALTIAAVLPAHAQSQAGLPGTQDSGPYIFGKDIYQFTVYPNGTGMVYKFDGPNKTVVGVIMQGQVSGFGGKPLGDAGNAYNEWHAKSLGSAGAAAAEPQPSTPAQPEVAVIGGGQQQRPITAGCNAANKAITLPNGAAVTFLDEDNATVCLPNAFIAGSAEHTAHYHGSSVGGALKGVALRNGGNVLGSIGGSGVAIDATLDDKGRVIASRFDTADGTNLRGRIAQFQPIIHAILEAAQTPAGTPFRSSHIVKSLEKNNAGIK